MIQLICRQRGCSLGAAEVVPILCPVCGNPLLSEDHAEVSHAKTDDDAAQNYGGTTDE